MNDFDHRPDSLLGEALREALATTDEAAFVQRVLARMPQQTDAESWWEVLGAWARPGLAAAAAALLAVAVWAYGGRSGSIAEDVAAVEQLNAGAVMMASAPLPDFKVDMVLGEERINE